MTNLTLNRTPLIITVNGSTQGSARGRTWCSISTGYASSLCQILLSLCLTNFYLLLLTAAAEFIRLEGILRLELGAAMLWNVAF